MRSRITEENESYKKHARDKRQSDIRQLNNITLSKLTLFLLVKIKSNHQQGAASIKLCANSGKRQYIIAACQTLYYSVSKGLRYSPFILRELIGSRNKNEVKLGIHVVSDLVLKNPKKGLPILSSMANEKNSRVNNLACTVIGVCLSRNPAIAKKLLMLFIKSPTRTEKNVAFKSIYNYFKMIETGLRNNQKSPKSYQAVIALFLTFSKYKFIHAILIKHFQSIFLGGVYHYAKTLIDTLSKEKSKLPSSLLQRLCSYINAAHQI